MGRAPLLSLEEGRARRGRMRRVATGALILPAALLLSGCSDAVARGWLPTTKDTTNQTGRIMELWNGSWIAAMAVAVLVWGLMFWCVVAYRRRRQDAPLPAQVRYNMPLEILYTVVPLIMVGVLFFYTARDQAAIADTSATPDVEIGVVGKQWSWDFNYLSDDVYETGVQVNLDGTEEAEEQAPVLYLPVGERVEFTVTSRDVIHSFWIPAFLYKIDAIPGIENTFQVVPEKEGTYRGKCAELCGEYHSEMLFTVKVVSREEYDAQMQALEDAGQIGQLETNLGRTDTPEGGATPGASGSAAATTEEEQD